jgi:2-(1,2-epoxy-1,2-dihydrophenyl)acetyl-CoA isomerase
MARIFNYNTLNVDLRTSTKSMVVELNRSESDNSINAEMIFELESLLAWTSSHIEIKSVLFKSSTQFFSPGFDTAELSRMGDERIQRALKKFQKIIYTLFFLPQTIIVDFGAGASGAASEFAIGADIRLAQKDTKISFNHINTGFVPACGGIGFLGAIVPKAIARKWVLTASEISETELLASGFVSEFYNIADYKILETISRQAEIPRIQTKRSTLEAILPELDRALEYEERFATAGMCEGDWRKESNFSSAKFLGAKLKEERRDQVAREFTPTLVN